ncbi:hypothetical protein AQUCO_00100181v1 [Aquilegia coerulea]|uniref:Uncharacterized protein n=1 Tax=Aquilegia coerulea TaxID=218851 RepID=A0A2G5F983_AQUCA|nr:hypothetical protein AQUCO_00100181v1 [Aquilegia coerulea]
MDLAPGELGFIGILKESINIPKQSLRTFFFIAITFILPLSVAILGHSRFGLPLLDLVEIQDSLRTRSDLTLFYLLLFGYPVIVFVFSLLSTAAVVFTVASLNSFRAVSFISTLSAIPRVFKRLFITFLFVSFLMIIYNFIFFILLHFLINFMFSVMDDINMILFWVITFTIFFTLLFPIHTYVTSLWHLASVVSVLEPVYGFKAMKKSKALLQGKTKMAMALVFCYLVLCLIIQGLFILTLVYGSLLIKIVVGGLLVVVLVILNMIGLLVQSVFYYVCKSYHHEGIDKSALNEHLGGYVGEYVPLKGSNVQMESVQAAV